MLIGQNPAMLSTSLDGVEYLDFNVPIKGTASGTVYVVGSMATVASAQVADYATDFAVRNQHVSILVNTIVAGGDIVITGTSLSEVTQVPVTSDTETITVDTTPSQRYQTSKKWIEVTNIDVSGVTTINYDIENIGYYDRHNTNFKVLGYRLDMLSNNINADMALVIYKVEDNGGNKYTLRTLENIGIDANSAGNQIVDNLRTAGDDRSYNPSVASLWGNNTVYTMKQNDFETYHGTSIVTCSGATSGSGIIVAITGEGDANPEAIDHINGHIRIQVV